MHYFSRIFCAILLCVSMTAAAPAWAADDAAPTALHHEREVFAKEFAQLVVMILHEPKKSANDRKNILRETFQASVDIDWIAKFVLGRSWKDATDEQRVRYTSLYKRYLTETYVKNFAENPDKAIANIKVAGVSEDAENPFMVRTQMLLKDAENLNVDYRVSEEDGHYKIRDIAIENVSLITTHRTEFGELASTEGVDGVIKRLETLLDNNSETILSMK